MRRQGTKRRQLMAEVGPAREAFLREFGACWFCGAVTALTVHEILSGTGGRDHGLRYRWAWAVACWPCNSNDLTDARRWPLARQLARKWVFDREHFDMRADLLEFNRLRGRGPRSIERHEIIPHICRDLDSVEGF